MCLGTGTGYGTRTGTGTGTGTGSWDWDRAADRFRDVDQFWDADRFRDVDWFQDADRNRSHSVLVPLRCPSEQSAQVVTQRR